LAAQFIRIRGKASVIRQGKGRAGFCFIDVMMDGDNDSAETSCLWD
jgi:hypothetical protein